MKGIEYRGVTSVDGPIVVLKRTENVFYNETVCVRDRLGEKRTGKVVDISEEAVVVQIFGSTTGLDLDEARGVRWGIYTALRNIFRDPKLEITDSYILHKIFEEYGRK